MEENIIKAPNIWFTADLHVHHLNILNHQKNRVKGMNLKSSDDITAHDKYIIDMITSMVKRGDRLYIIGDMMFGSREQAIDLLSKIHCDKFFINGNHDKAFNQLDNYFAWKGDIKTATFKKELYPYLKQDFEVCMCHYPMLSWPRKSYGTMMLHGHTHNNAPFENECNDLRLNVGIDNPLCNFKLFSLEQVYNEYEKKLKGLNPRRYIEKVSKEDKHFIR